MIERIAPGEPEHEKTAKCSCSHCCDHLEFPISARGTEIACPNCGKQTLLDVPEDSEPARTDVSESALTVPQIVAAFGGSIPAKSPSMAYVFGLLLVVGSLLIFAILLVGLIAAVGVKTNWGFSAILVLLMVKPLCARRAPCAQPLVLNPSVEPLLFAFVTEICKATRTACPERIEVDCQLNAAAGLKRGARGFLGKECVVRLGLPLIGGLAAREFAAVIAHEVGHCSQTFAARLGALVQGVNLWLYRIAHEPDAWDLMFSKLAAMPSLLFIFAGAFGRLLAWGSRQLIKGLLLLSHGISCVLIRQEEHGADDRAIRVGGSAIFESMLRRMNLLAAALQMARKNLALSWEKNRALPIDFTDYVLAQADAIPERIKTQLSDTLGLRSTRWFDTHPSDGDRIQRARQAGARGICSLDGSARDLFSNFDVLSRQVTLLHYSEDLRLPVGLAKFFVCQRALTPSPSQSS
jgi:Zn-dependent protease with chaperone function